MKKSGTLLLILGLVVSVFASYSATSADPAGELPVWYVDDSWWFINVSNDTAYDMIRTITGEATIDGTDCYEETVRWIPDTPLNASWGMHNDMRLWYDKTSLLTVKINATGELSGYPYIYNTTYSYEIEMINGTSMWPRVVNHEWNLTTTTWETVWIYSDPFWTLYMNNTYSTVTRTKVEAFENLTVQEGTAEERSFMCFKTADYNETDYLLNEWWHSDDVRTSIKNINYDTPGYKSGQHGPDILEFVRRYRPGDVAKAYGEINIVDVVYVAIHFDSKKGELEYDPIADINGDDFVNIVDIVIVALDFDETYPW